MLCISNDDWINKNCVKVGFSVRSSRKYKFYLFFLCLGFMLLGRIMVANSNQFSSYQKKIWMINATNEPGCKKDYYGL